MKVVDQKICNVVLDLDLPSSSIELPKLTGINNHTINLIEETLKTYVETNLANRFIRLSKSQNANAHFLRSSEPLDCLGRIKRCVLSS